MAYSDEQQNSALPPPARSSDRAWGAFLSIEPAMTSDLMQYRPGFHPNPVMIRQQPGIRTPVAVPHPSHKKYTVVEMSKRNMAEAERKQKIQRMNPVTPITEQPRFILPEHVRMFQQCRPDIGCFNHMPKIRLPGVYHGRL